MISGWLKWQFYLKLFTSSILLWLQSVPKCIHYSQSMLWSFVNIPRSRANCCWFTIEVSLANCISDVCDQWPSVLASYPPPPVPPPRQAPIVSRVRHWLLLGFYDPLKKITQLQVARVFSQFILTCWWNWHFFSVLWRTYFMVITFDVFIAILYVNGYWVFACFEYVLCKLFLQHLRFINRPGCMY